MYTTSALLQLVGLVLAGVLVEPLGAVTLNIQGLGYVAAGAAMLVLLPRAIDTDAASRSDRQLSLLRSRPVRVPSSRL